MYINQPPTTTTTALGPADGSTPTGLLSLKAIGHEYAPQVREVQYRRTQPTFHVNLEKSTPQKGQQAPFITSSAAKNGSTRKSLPQNHPLIKGHNRSSPTSAHDPTLNAPHEGGSPPLYNQTSNDLLREIANTQERRRNNYYQYISAGGVGAKAKGTGFNGGMMRNTLSSFVTRSDEMQHHLASRGDTKQGPVSKGNDDLAAVSLKRDSVKTGAKNHLRSKEIRQYAADSQIPSKPLPRKKKNYSLLHSSQTKYQAPLQLTNLAQAYTEGVQSLLRTLPFQQSPNSTSAQSRGIAPIVSASVDLKRTIGLHRRGLQVSPLSNYAAATSPQAAQERGSGGAQSPRRQSITLPGPLLTAGQGEDQSNQNSGTKLMPAIGAQQYQQRNLQQSGYLLHEMKSSVFRVEPAQDYTDLKLDLTSGMATKVLTEYQSQNQLDKPHPKHNGQDLGPPQRSLYKIGNGRLGQPRHHGSQDSPRLSQKQWHSRNKGTEGFITLEAPPAQADGSQQSGVIDTKLPKMKGQSLMNVTIPVEYPLGTNYPSGGGLQVCRTNEAPPQKLFSTSNASQKQILAKKKQPRLQKKSDKQSMSTEKRIRGILDRTDYHKLRQHSDNNTDGDICTCLNEGQSLGGLASPFGGPAPTQIQLSIDKSRQHYRYQSLTQTPLHRDRGKRASHDKNCKAQRVAAALRRSNNVLSIQLRPLKGKAIEMKEYRSMIQDEYGKEKKKKIYETMIAGTHSSEESSFLNTLRLTEGLIGGEEQMTLQSPFEPCIKLNLTSTGSAFTQRTSPRRYRINKHIKLQTISPLDGSVAKEEYVKLDEAVAERLNLLNTTITSSTESKGGLLGHDSQHNSSVMQSSPRASSTTAWKTSPHKYQSRKQFYLFSPNGGGSNNRAFQGTTSNQRYAPADTSGPFLHRDESNQHQSTHTSIVNLEIQTGASSSHQAVPGGAKLTTSKGNQINFGHVGLSVDSSLGQVATTDSQDKTGDYYYRRMMEQKQQEQQQFESTTDDLMIGAEGAQSGTSVQFIQQHQVLPFGRRFNSGLATKEDMDSRGDGSKASGSGLQTPQLYQPIQTYDKQPKLINAGVSGPKAKPTKKAKAGSIPARKPQIQQKRNLSKPFGAKKQTSRSPPAAQGQRPNQVIELTSPTEVGGTMAPGSSGNDYDYLQVQSHLQALGGISVESRERQVRRDLEEQEGEGQADPLGYNQDSSVGSLPKFPALDELLSKEMHLELCSNPTEVEIVRAPSVIGELQKSQQDWNERVQRQIDMVAQKKADENRQKSGPFARKPIDLGKKKQPADSQRASFYAPTNPLAGEGIAKKSEIARLEEFYSGPRTAAEANRIEDEVHKALPALSSQSPFVAVVLPKVAPEYNLYGH